MACPRSSNVSGQSPASSQGPASQIRAFSFPAQASQTQQAMFCLGLGKGPVERLVSLPYFSDNEVSERDRDLPEVRQPESNTTHPLDSGVLTPPRPAQGFSLYQSPKEKRKEPTSTEHQILDTYSFQSPKPWRQMFLSTFKKSENRGSERRSDLPKATRLVVGSIET